MKKRLLALSMAMIMAAGSLTACGGDTAATPAETPAATEAAATEAPAEGGEAAATEAPAEGGEAAATEAPAEAATESVPENEVSGDATAADAFVVWGWNTDIKNILDNVYKDVEPENYSRIVFVNTGGSDTYQTKIDAMLDTPDNKLYPDVMGLEVDYVQKYVNSGDLLSNDDLGITTDDMSEMYQYNKDLGTNKEDGKIYAFFWQATPGCFQIRADLAEKWLGTTDPQELHDTVFKDVDTILEKARDVYTDSEGKVALFSGYDELLRMFSNSRTTGWYDSNDVVTIDAQMDKYIDTAAAIAPYTFKTSQWSTGWYSAMGSYTFDETGKTEEEIAEAKAILAEMADKEAIAYCGCPWFTYFCLSDSWKNNTVLVEAPFSFFWGGTGLAATTGCSDVDMASNIIKHFTCDQDFMVKINDFNGDFVNNKSAVSAQAGKANDYTANGQDLLGFYQPKANSIDASTVTAEDQDINSFFNAQVDAVAQQNKAKDAAINDFKNLVVDKFNYLKLN